MNNSNMDIVSDSLNWLAEKINTNNIKLGWRGPDAEPRTFGDDISLLHSEVSEMLEAYRDFGTTETFRAIDGQFVAEFKNPDGTLNKPEGVGPEAADVLIRLLDTCREYGIDLGRETERKLKYNETRSFRHGGKKL